MSIKLTLRVSPTLIKRAKIYAKDHGKSVSQIVSDYFSLLTYNLDSANQNPTTTLPLTKSLRGILKDTKLAEKDYKKHLEKKYL